MCGEHGDIRAVVEAVGEPPGKCGLDLVDAVGIAGHPSRWILEGVDHAVGVNEGERRDSYQLSLSAVEVMDASVCRKPSLVDEPDSTIGAKHLSEQGKEGRRVVIATDHKNGSYGGQ